METVHKVTEHVIERGFQALDCETLRCELSSKASKDLGDFQANSLYAKFQVLCEKFVIFFFLKSSIFFFFFFLKK